MRVERDIFVGQESIFTFIALNIDVKHGGLIKIPHGFQFGFVKIVNFLASSCNFVLTNGKILEHLRDIVLVHGKILKVGINTSNANQEKKP